MGWGLEADRVRLLYSKGKDFMSGSWLQTLREGYNGNLQEMIDEMEDDELLDAIEELNYKALKQEAKARGLPVTLRFE